jgi:hypothetical protein
MCSTSYSNWQLRTGLPTSDLYDIFTFQVWLASDVRLRFRRSQHLDGSLLLRMLTEAAKPQKFLKSNLQASGSG